MPGVEILASSEVLVSGGFDVKSLLIIFSIWVVIGFISGIAIAWTTLEELWMIYGMLIGATVGIFLGALTSGIRSTPEEYETHYKVLVSDEVSMNEFLEEYEIIYQEGKIYTVKEKADKE